MAIKPLDQNGLIFLWSQLKTIFAKKTDLPTVEKIAEWDAKSNFSGNYTDLSNKPMIPTVPSNISTFTNDAGYTIASEVQTLINSSIGEGTGMSFEIVAELPTTGTSGKIYLLNNSGTAPNVYTEYIWTANNTYEIIGNTAVDLSGYVLASDLVPITNAEIDVILAQ